MHGVFFNPDIQDFTWSNSNLSFRSRIDLFLVSSSALQYVNEISHSFAPLSDHKKITLKLGDSQHRTKLRGYWKFNNTLLKDNYFNDSLKNVASEIFNGVEDNEYTQKWEYFKFMTRTIAVKRGKELKALKNKTEADLLSRIGFLLSKPNLSFEEELELKEIQLKIDQIYIELAKGAFARSRSKWLEEGEANTSNFFALEKRNGQKKSLSMLNINGSKCADQKLISDSVFSFYSNLYKSEFKNSSCELFMDKIKKHMVTINEDLKKTCDSNLTREEVRAALFSMKKGKSPGIDGLSVEFYIHFRDIIQEPLFYMYCE